MMRNAGKYSNRFCLVFSLHFIFLRSQLRSNGEPVGFAECLQRDSFDSYKEGRLLLRLQKFQFNTTEDHSNMIEKLKQEKSESKLIFSNFSRQRSTIIYSIRLQ